MKKLLYIIPLLFGMALTSCYNDDIIDINNRLYDLEKDTRVATIQEQIVGIQNSLAALEDTDKELGGYITALEAEAESLEAKLAETNTKIDNVKNELSETISTEKANILAELEAFKATVNGELDAIKSVLETLKAKDVELDGKIATLQEYVDGELKATEDWATATFATLEQYEAVTTSIATIEGTIEGLNESLAALETRLGEKIAKDIETACATLSADLQAAVEDITTAYTSAIATAKQEIEEAYTAAIKAAIATSEASMKEWVNEQLAGYYTIAEIDAKLEVLKATATDGDKALQNEIDALETSLAEQKTEITKAYQNAIAEAITANNGVIDEKIATEITTVNAKITGLEERVDDLESRVTKLEGDVEALVNRVQSVSYIPKYSDGKATIDTENQIGVFDFQISPKDAIVELEKIWESALSMQAVHTQTRAVSFIELPITCFEADAASGTFSIEVDAKNLGDNFFAGEIEASAALYISDGNNNHTTSYINLTLGTEDSITKNGPAENEIWYTSTDGEGVSLFRNGFGFGANIVSNTYEDGKGVITFDGDITSIGDDAFFQCSELTSIIIPNCVTSIGERVFVDCSNLASITIPDSVVSIGKYAFLNCDALTSIDFVPDSVVSIGDGAFGGCSNIKKFEGKFAADGGRCLIVDNRLVSVITGLTEYTIPEGVTAIGDCVFDNQLAYYSASKDYDLISNIVIPNSVESIGIYAFRWLNINSISLPQKLSYIGKGAFKNCPISEVHIPDINSWCNISLGEGALTSNYELYCEGQLVENVTIPNDCFMVKDYAFAGCSSLTSITIPDSVTTIGSSAFDGCI